MNDEESDKVSDQSANSQPHETTADAHESEAHTDHDHAHEEPHADEAPLEDSTLATSADGHVHAEGGDFWAEYFGLLTDPAHVAFELTMSAIVDLFIIFLGYKIIWKGYIYPRLRRSIHQELDAEHHVVHHDHAPGVSPEDCVNNEKHHAS